MIDILDTLPRPHGRLECDVWRLVGGHEQLVEHTNGENLVVTSGLHALLQAIGGVASRVVTQFGVGTSGTAAALGDTALTGVVRVAAGAITYPTSTSIAIAWNVARGVATGLSIREFGLFTADNTLVARKVRAGAIVKGADIRISGTWTLHF